MVSKLSKILQMRYTLMPTLRRLRRVLKIVDILLDVQWLLRSSVGRLMFKPGGIRQSLFCTSLFVPCGLKKFQTTTPHSILCHNPDFKEAMIVRSVVRCSATRRLQLWHPRLLQTRQCGFSTSASPIAAANGPSQASMLGAFTTELDKIAPRFDVQGTQIQILRSPSEFYETLKVGHIAFEH
jgi:hypothetical protein